MWGSVSHLAPTVVEGLCSRLRLAAFLLQFESGSSASIWKVLPSDWASLVAQMIKNPPAMQKTWV